MDLLLYFVHCAVFTRPANIPSYCCISGIGVFRNSVMTIWGKSGSRDGNLQHDPGAWVWRVLGQRTEMLKTNV